MIINSITKRRAALVSVLLCALAAEPVNANAGCVPATLGNYLLPFTLVSLSTGQVASYVSGDLSGPGNGTLSGSGSQLFSDRFGPCPSAGQSGTLKLCAMQPFTVTQADSLGVQIVPVGSSYNVTITLESWGNGKFSFTASCDKTTNLLYGSASWSPNTNNTMVLMSFGTPIAPPK